MSKLSIKYEKNLYFKWIIIFALLSIHTCYFLIVFQIFKKKTIFFEDIFLWLLESQFFINFLNISVLFDVNFGRRTNLCLLTTSLLSFMTLFCRMNFLHLSWFSFFNKKHILRFFCIILNISFNYILLFCSMMRRIGVLRGAMLKLIKHLCKTNSRKIKNVRNIIPLYFWLLKILFIVYCASETLLEFFILLISLI